jgi:molybdenum-dependent DNA-binding transcriptional regulator ModE
METKKRGRTCQCCAHPRIADLNRDLVRGGIAKNAVGRKYGIHPDAVHRHARDHVTEQMRREIAVEIKRDRAQSVATELNDERLDIGSTYDALARRVEKLISKAEQEGNDGLALASMEGLRKILHDIATMQGKLAQQLTVQVSLIESKEWIELRTILEPIFRAHPAAGAMFLEQARRRRLSIAHAQ